MLSKSVRNLSPTGRLTQYHSDARYRDEAPEPPRSDHATLHLHDLRRHSSVRTRGLDALKNEPLRETSSTEFVALGPGEVRYSPDEERTRDRQKQARTQRRDL